MAENCLELITDTKPQIQEAQTTTNRLNTKKYTRRHIIFKLQKPKTKGKSEMEKNSLPVEERRITADFLLKTIQARVWNEIFKALKEKNTSLEFYIQ